MPTLPLIFKDGHLFVELEKRLWLFDTGSPASFGDTNNLAIDSEEFSLKSSYMGLSAATLSDFIGVQCSGLLGADILGNFDHVLDCVRESLSLSVDELHINGQLLHISAFMGIPVVTAQIVGENYNMFFDTGAQFSYFQHDSLSVFPAAGRVTDFYPGIGPFQTDTYQVDIVLGETPFTLRCGTLPDPLEATLMMAGTQGIIGNQILDNRVIGYFPRRGELCL